MTIVYLCPKKYFDHKMSRGRFHAVEAIQTEVRENGGELFITGNGWPGYDETKTVSENFLLLGLQADLVIGYMPFEMKAFADLQIPKVMTYNEMYNHEKVSRQLEQSRPELVICHHENEMPYYAERFPQIIFKHLPHCAKENIFKDYGLPKTWDVLVVGRLSSERYPLRTRVSYLLNKFPPQYRCRVFPHPGYEIPTEQIERQVLDYAKALNSSRICVTCSGTIRSRYAKYAEIPRCHSVLCADLPGEDQDFFRQFTLEIKMEMTNDEIIRTITSCLEDQKRYETLLRKGVELSAPYTQTYYAKEFLKIVRQHLKVPAIKTS